MGYYTKNKIALDKNLNTWYNKVLLNKKEVVYMSLIEFMNAFNSDKVCEEYLIESRKEAGLSCPCCNYPKIYTLNTKTKYNMFKCAKCKQRFSVLTGTIFERSHIPLQKWFLAIFLLTTTKKGISSIELGEKLPVTQKSAWFLLHRLKECMNDKDLQLFEEVEMDETFIGGKEKNKHASKKKGYHGTQGKTAVMGAISREDKKVIAYPRQRSIVLY